MEIKLVGKNYIDKDELSDGYRSIGIMSDRLKACARKYKWGKFNGIFGHSSFGFTESNFNFVKHFRNAKRIWFWDIKVDSIEGLYNLKNAEYFGVLGKKPGIDFSFFSNLRTLIMEWDKKDSSIELCEKIELFNLWHHKPKEKSFKNFKFPKYAKEVGLFWTNSESLESINGLKGIKKIHIARSKNLKTLRGLEAYSETLEHVIIETCGKLEDFKFVLDFPNLKWANINRKVYMDKA